MDDPHETQAAEPTPATEVTLEESPETRLVVVGNAEMLSDFVAQALGQIDGGFFEENLRFAQNLVDWVSLDNEMLRIRTRGATTRRLARTDRPTQLALEWANYLAPVLLLTLLGSYLHWKRRRVLPVAGRRRPTA